MLFLLISDVPWVFIMCIFSLGSIPSGSFTPSVYHIRWHPPWASSQFYCSGIILRFMRVWFNACLYSHFKLPEIFYEEHSCFQYKAFIWAFSPPNADIRSSLVAYFKTIPIGTIEWKFISIFLQLQVDAHLCMLRWWNKIIITRTSFKYRGYLLYAVS